MGKREWMGKRDWAANGWENEIGRQIDGKTRLGGKLVGKQF